MIGPATDTRPSRSSRRSSRRRAVARRGQREQLGVAALALALVGSVLLFGAQHTPVLVPAALLCVVSALLLPPTRVPRLAWLCGALSVFCCLQLVPLPSSWVARLSPAGHGVWSGTLLLLGETRRFLPLSIDPSATLLEALKWAAYACVVSAASGWRARRSSAALSVLVFGAALTVAVIELTHGLFDVQRIYGLYRPLDASRWVRGPLVNGNHLAGYLNLGLFAGVGLWVSERMPRLSWPIALGCPTLVAGVLLSNSRGGIACLLVGAVLFATLTLRGRLLPSGRTRQALGVVLVVGVALTLLVGGSRMLVPLADRDVHAKTRVWLWSLDLIRDFPWFGAGRGAFETAFLPYRRLLPANWATLYAHAENLPLEWAADWGVPVALLAMAGFAWCALPAFPRGLRDPNAAGFVAGLTALTLQNLTDFSLEVFAVAALAGVAFAGVDDSPGSSTTRRSLRVVAPLALLGAAAAALVVLTGAAPVQSERRSLSREASAKQRGPELTALGNEVRAALLRHPGDAYPPLVGAVIAERSQKDPLKWLGRALERSPYEGNAHLMLARVLARHGARAQALLHVRYAAMYDLTLREQALLDASRWARTKEDLVRAFPRDVPGAELLAQFCPLLADGLRIECARELVDRAPSDANQQALATALLDAWEARKEPCSIARTDSCAAEVASVFQKLPSSEKAVDWQLAVTRARWFSLAGKPRDAADHLLRRCPTSAEAATCWERALWFASAARDLPLLNDVGQRYAASHCNDPTACAVAHETLAETYSALSAWGSALNQLNIAIREDPTVERWLRSADFALRAGATRSARTALDRAERIGHLTGPQRQRLDALRALLLERD